MTWIDSEVILVSLVYYRTHTDTGGYKWQVNYVYSVCLSVSQFILNSLPRVSGWTMTVTVITIIIETRNNCHSRWHLTHFMIGWIVHVYMSNRLVVVIIIICRCHYYCCSPWIAYDFVFPPITRIKFHQLAYIIVKCYMIQLILLMMTILLHNWNIIT